MSTRSSTTRASPKADHEKPLSPQSTREAGKVDGSIDGNIDVEAGQKGTSTPAGQAMQAPIDVPRWRFWAIFISLMFGVFLFALDQLILATATPVIVSEFNALDQLPWLANGFFLTLLGFNLIYSQWNQIFPSKIVMLFAIFIFEVGSLICGVAPGIEVLILGRAITGIGASGIFSGGMIIIAELTSLHDRAQYFALFGACFAIASVVGPLVGGAFTDHVSWRWCFYINLPFGGLAMAMIAFFQPVSPPLGQAKTYKGFNRGMFWQVVKCDWGGVVISMAWAVCLILWLQWGGQTRSWSNGGVITCLVLSVVLIPVFLGYEYWLGDKAMFKLALMKRRTISGAAVLLFFLFGLFMVEVYYISLAFQSLYGKSATNSGIRLLPFILVQVFFLILSSRIIPKIGRFKYVICAGPFFLSIGCGLLYTIKYGMSINHLMGYQVFLGVGIGLSLQNTMLAIQHELKSEPWLISAGTGTGVFIGFGGRILGLSLGGNVFGNMIQVHLREYASDLSPAIFNQVVSSADAVWKVVPEREGVLRAYAETLREVFLIGVPFAICALIGGLCIKNSKMLSKAEEEAAIQASKDGANGTTDKEGRVDGDVKDRVDAGEEERIAEGISAVGPQETVSDSQVSDKREDKSLK